MRPSAFPFYGITDTKAATNNNSPPVIGETSSESLRIVTVSGNDTATTSDFGILVNAAANNFTVTLPPAASSFTSGNGQLLMIKKIDSSTHTVTIKGSGAELIDFTNTIVTAVQGDAYLLQSTGTKWVILARYKAAESIITTTINYTATAADFTILVDASGGSRTITLPTPANFKGKIFNIKKIDSSNNSVIISQGSVALNAWGDIQLIIATTDDSYTVQCDGTQYWTI